MLFPRGSLALLLQLLLLLLLPSCIARYQRQTTGPVRRYAQSRDRGREPTFEGEAVDHSNDFFGDAFTDAEDSLLRQREGDTAEMLAQALSGRSALQVQRRCVELRLRCGGISLSPPPSSESRKARLQRWRDEM
ncbi:hypothetical protein P43SY_000784 [Pythium insidiosum]|uniref:Transmembrane protein n=1 Tax=Pythium insidiosum TaxID=114742 RepID=A0AAD5M8F1_PYTIN|nr:hypothetical protein P43SY_000784 [Pythium insidiosum]